MAPTTKRCLIVSCFLFLSFPSRRFLKPYCLRRRLQPLTLCLRVRLLRLLLSAARGADPTLAADCHEYARGPVFVSNGDSSAA